MCAWHVLAMLRRVACVGACHSSPHHTTCFFCCCAAALGARVHRCGNIGTFKNSNHLDTNQPILIIYLRSQRQFFNEYFFCFFCEERRRQTAADKVRRAKRYYRGRTMCACRILPLRWRVAFVIAFHVFLSSCSLVLDTCSLHIFFFFFLSSSGWGKIKL